MSMRRDLAIVRSINSREPAKRHKTWLERNFEGPIAQATALRKRWTAIRMQLSATKAPSYPKRHPAVSIPVLFERQVEKTPGAEAVVWWGGRLTYGELNERANQLAHYLERQGVKRGDRVGVLLPRTGDLVAAMLGIMKAGGAYVPLDGAYPKERIAYMVEDSGCKVVVSREQEALRAGCSEGRMVYLGKGERDQGEVEKQIAENFKQAWEADERDLAYVIYTSGSTGRPKGVGIEHRSALVLMEWVGESFGADELGGMLASTSVCFDLSVFEIFGPLSHGGRVLLARDVLELPELSYRREVRLVNTVPSAMRELLGLKGLGGEVKTVCLAGEAFPGALARDLGKEAGVERILNLYGPTEDTTYSTCWTVDGKSEEEPKIGRPLPGSAAYVADEAGELCPIGAAGELYLGGAGLARGYERKPELTAERFVPDGFGAEEGGRLYRTGDRVRMRDSGELEYVGRLDEQVKLRGYRVELGEVERVLAEQAGVKESVVVVKQGPGGDRRLVAYCVGEVKEKEVMEGMRRKLPGYMMPAVVVKLEKMPRTANGKRDRKQLPEPKWSGAGASGGVGGETRDEEEVGKRTTLEEQVLGIWKEVLGLKTVGVEDDFLALGGHSLLATRIVARLREETGRELALSQFFKHATVASLAKLVEFLPRSTGERLITRDYSQGAPLSAAQKQMWFQARLDPDDSSYNVPCCIRISGSVDAGRMEEALNQCIARQTALRTKVQTRDGRPRQFIEPAVRVKLRAEKISSATPSDADAELRRRALGMAAAPLDLERAPLLRAALFELGEKDWALVVVVHHIVFDEWSLYLLVKEIASIYQTLEEGGQPPIPFAFQFADFCSWEESNNWSDALAFWKKQLAGAPSILRLPADHPRPERSTMQGAGLVFVLDPAWTQGIEALAVREKATVFMVLSAAFQVLLATVSRQNDFVTVTAVAGRANREMEELIGCFINMVPLRATVDDGENFAQLLRRVRDNVLESLNYQQVPFERIVDELRPPRDPHHAPIAQVAFGLQNAPHASLELGTRTYNGTELRPDQVRLDLTVWVDQRSGSTRIAWTYRTDLFLEATIRRFQERYSKILQQIAASAEVSVAALRSIGDKKSMPESSPRKSFPGRLAPKAFGAGELAKIEAGWLGLSLPTMVRAQVPGLNLADWARSHRELIETHMRGSAGILFRGFHVETVQDFQQFSQAVASEVVKYGERSSPRTEIAEGVYTSTDHPPDQPIVLHNEQSYTLNWPMRILFFCARPALKYGRTPIADSRNILRRLSPRTVDKFDDLGVLYVRNYLPGISLPWTEVFQTQDPRKAEDYCRAASLDFEWIDNGERLRTRQLRPALRIHPVTEERTWFNHALFFHVTSLPVEVSQSLRSAVAEEDLPYNTYYGDGSRIEDSVLHELRDAYEAETVSFDWEKGDVLLLDNMLIAHGREPFEGPREIRAAMVDPFVSLYGKPESRPAGALKEAM
jgi:amino acid adenylation domain-containing protein